jgi:hypothetical protein
MTMDDQLPKSVASTKPRRRWYQFSLRTMLIVSVLFSFAAAWYGSNHLRIDKRDRLVAQLEADFCQVICGTNRYHYGAFSDAPVGSDPQPWFLPRWIFGREANETILGLQVYPTARLFNNNYQVLREMPELALLGLHGTKCDDRVIKEIHDCAPNLRMLEFSYTEVTAASFRELHRFKDLRSIFALNLDDACLECFSTITQLEQLIISDSNITDLGLEHLGRLENLRKVNLNLTSITGSGFARFKPLPNLRFLRITGECLNDQGMANIVKMAPSITELFVGEAKLTDFAVNEILKLKQLQMLEISGTEISEDGLKRLVDNLNLKELQVSRAISQSTLDYLGKKLPGGRLKLYPHAP